MNGPMLCVRNLLHVMIIAVLGMIMPIGCDPPDDDIDLIDDIEPRVSLGTFNATQGVMKNAGNIFVPASRRVTACLMPIQGDPDLYMRSGAWPTFSSYFTRSQRNGLTPDCIWFNTLADTSCYLGVYGYASGTSTGNLWYVSSNVVDVPAIFNANNKLTWPVVNFKSLVNSFSAFGSPWGNALSVNNPFFPDEEGMIHSGVDIKVTANTPVIASCTGVVKLNGDAGSTDGWGYYTILECDNPKVSIGYVHLNNAGRPALGKISVGQSMGTVLDMSVAGEEDHLHLGICADSYDNCLAAKSKPSCGRLKYDGGGNASQCSAVFPGKFINPFIGTNPGIWK